MGPEGELGGQGGAGLPGADGEQGTVGLDGEPGRDDNLLVAIPHKVCDFQVTMQHIALVHVSYTTTLTQ